MTQVMWIPVRFPGMNEIVASAKGFKGKGIGYSKLKAQFTSLVANRARALKLMPVTGQVRLSLLWVEPNKRRDPDNFTCAKKFLMDGLVEAGILADDGWDEIRCWTETWGVGEVPGVRLEISDSE